MIQIFAQQSYIYAQGKHINPIVAKNLLDFAKSTSEINLENLNKKLFHK